jgi:hypothetical protein
MVQPLLTAVPKRPDSIKPTVVGDKTRAFVVANPYGYNSALARVLHNTIDDVEMEVNFRAYDRMEKTDSAVAKSKRILVTNVLCDDIQLAPGATEDEVGKEEYDTYVQVQEFCERMLKGLDSPARSSLEQLLGNAIKYGHGIAETEWEYRLDAPSTKPKEQEPKGRIASLSTRFSNWWKGDVTADAKTGPTKPALSGQKTRLMPSAIKVKPRESTKFVVDEFMNVLGLVPANKFQAGLKVNEIIDREKFLVLTLNKQDEDPRGSSMYRPAFNWVNVRSMLPTEMVRYIIEETVPKAVGTMAEDAPPFEFERDDNGDIVYDDPDTKQQPRMLTSAESFKRQIENFKSGSGAVIPHGATLKPYKQGLTGSNDAELFNKLLAITGREIEGTILLQSLAQSEGEHQSKSASQQVAEILYNLVFYIRWEIASVLLKDFLEVGVKLNLGDWAVRYLPLISLGDAIRRDWIAELEAVADAYFKGLLDDTQRAEIMAWLNLPKPGPSRQEQNLEAAAKQDVNGQPIQPNSNRPDKSAAGQGRNNGNGTEKKRNAKNIGRGTINSMGYHSRWFRRS